jgi:MOSC domain-containing protein YiiM
VFDPDADISNTGETRVAHVHSVQVGQPRDYVDGQNRTWRSAIAKTVTVGTVSVCRTNIAGDQQADLVHHGGVDKEVLVYSADHFAAWAAEFPELEVTAGTFGENVTIVGMNESDVCIGDTYRVGTCEFQVSQPRQPCWKLARHTGLSRLAARVQQTGRTGCYQRVLTEGQLTAGDDVILLQRHHTEWSIARANRVMYAKPRRAAEEEALLQCPALSEAWRAELLSRVHCT